MCVCVCIRLFRHQNLRATDRQRQTRRACVEEAIRSCGKQLSGARPPLARFHFIFQNTLASGIEARRERESLVYFFSTDAA